MSSGAGRRFLWGALLAAAVFLPFYQLAYSDRAMFFRDLSRDLLVQKALWAQAIRAGEGIPLWNRFALGGTPFYTMIVGSPQHPLNALFLLFPSEEAPRALAWYLWLHYLAFAVGSALLLRAKGLRRSTALLMAATAAGSGFLLSAHSLGHLVAAGVAVPWFFLFAHRFLRERSPGWLVLASAAIAWPVYAGDPQFTYVLALLSAFLFLRRRLWREWLALGALSFLAAAAQLLPTAREILQSERLAIDSTELLHFSFHPVRFAELLVPFFFGNRYGVDNFWGGELVNFPYRQPFIFSVYPGYLCLLTAPLIPFLFRARRRVAAILLLAVVFGFCLGTGKFFPLALYEWLSRWVPFFGLFRYPERILFWPLFGLWFLCALSLERALRLPRLLRSPAVLIAGAAFLAILVALLRFGPRRALVPFLGVALALELSTQQSQLVWFQSKHMAGGERYEIVRELKESLAARSEEIARGAAFRLGTEKFRHLEFNTARMDHTVSTTFNLFENLAPNTAGYFGLEDVSGYFSFMPARRVAFWKSIVASGAPGINDLRFFHDVMGVHYVPGRDPETQRPRLEVNDTALPYLYVPERVLLRPTFEDSLRELRAGVFRPNRDAVLAGLTGATVEQKGERGNFRILERHGRGLSFTYEPGPGGSERYLVVSESFHDGWSATANGRPLPLWTANGWSMITKLHGVQEGVPVRIELRFVPPWLYPGLALSALWLVLVAGIALRARGSRPR